MQLTALHPPKTLMEVYRMLPEGTRAELINNQLFMSPAPTTIHQKVIVTLTGQFYNYINEYKNGEVLVSPVDVFLDAKNAVQPDIVFVANENASILKDDGIHGAPDLVIEVLSPGTEKHDLNKKKKLYEKSGVKEYWIVDPITKESQGYQLKDSKYVLFKEEDAKLTSALLNHSFTF